MGNAIYNEIKKSQRNELQSKVVKVEIIEQKEFPFYILWILGSIPITTLICYFLCISCRRR
jgi:ABC-type multidrug transport system permease subunit